MTIVARYVDSVQHHSRAVIAILLIATVIVGTGGMFVDGGFVIADFESDAPEADASAFINENFGEDDRAVTILAHREEIQDDALSKTALIESLTIQSEIRNDPTIQPTLATESSVGIANLLGIQFVQADTDLAVDEITLEDKIDAIEKRDEGEIDEQLNALTTDPDRELLRLLPADITIPTDSAHAHLVIVNHQLDRAVDLDNPPQELFDAQVAIGDIAEGFGGDYDHLAFGPAIVDERSTQATGESFAFLGPLAVILVLLFLIVAYRDLLDVLLALGGIGFVMIWMAGIIGWLDIQVTQILIAVPFLLIGLSIDYALHVVMRYREERSKPGSTVDSAAYVGFTGVIVAIGATTVTTSIGFFSNLTSDISSISDFGLLSGLGIISAFVIFGALLPAVKIELEQVLERRGRERRLTAIGTTGSSARVLASGTRIARAIPVLLVVVILLTSLAGAYGAVNVDTSLDQNEFLPDDRPTWMDIIPEPLRPGEYAIKEQAIFLQTNFAGVDANARTDILIQGDVTDAEVFSATEKAAQAAATSSVTFTFANGDPAVDTPLSTIERIAETDSQVADRLAAADTTEDGIPDTEITALFDAAFEADASAMNEVVSRDDDGSYDAVRIDVIVVGTADGETVMSEMRSVAKIADQPQQVTAIATGTLILLEIVQDALLQTLITTFAITLVLVGAFLTVLFWLRHRSKSLGVVTMAPVLVALSWILGAMYLLDIPYNSETAIITAIAIGIGVDFAIHMTERYLQERTRLDKPDEALAAAISGTGGAILASAATTVVGFGILALTLVPSLQRFGIVTGLTIAFAFVASVLVLPSLLVLWDRYADHDHSTATPSE